jgi:hypothetical protein
MTAQNEPIDPTVYEDIEPDPEIEEEPYQSGETIESHQDTEEAPYFEPSLGAGGPDRYKYGKVPANLLTVTSETVERPYVCCGYSSAQMAARTAKAGVSADLKREGHQIRARGGRAHNAGSNATELRNGLQRALSVDVDEVSKGSILGRLRAGYAVTVSLNYGPLPEYLKVQGGDFGHSVCLRGYRESNGVAYVGYFDPLWPQGAQGGWAKWTDIDQAVWSSGHNTTKVKYVPPTPPTNPPTTGGTEVKSTPRTPKVVHVPAGQYLYVKPDLSANSSNVKIDPARDMPLAGWMPDGVLAVGYLPTANPPSALTVMYAPKTLTVKDAPSTATPPPPVHTGPTEAEVLAIKQAEYDRIAATATVEDPAPRVVLPPRP